MGRYINPFTDVGFKIIFGQEINKSLLIHFLNNVIEEFTIEDVTFLDKQQLPEYDEQLRRVLPDKLGAAHHCGDAESQPAAFQRPQPLLRVEVDCPSRRERRVGL